jgi:hypothetical protein
MWFDGAAVLLAAFLLLIGLATPIATAVRTAQDPDSSLEPQDLIDRKPIRSLA